jgi:hypothetical protein
VTLRFRSDFWKVSFTIFKSYVIQDQFYLRSPPQYPLCPAKLNLRTFENHKVYLYFFVMFYLYLYLSVNVDGNGYYEFRSIIQNFRFIVMKNKNKKKFFFFFLRIWAKVNRESNGFWRKLKPLLQFRVSRQCYNAWLVTDD